MATPNNPALDSVRRWQREQAAMSPSVDRRIGKKLGVLAMFILMPTYLTHCAVKDAFTDD